MNMSSTITITESHEAYRTLVKQLHLPYDPKPPRTSEEKVASTADEVFPTLSSKENEADLSEKAVVPYFPKDQSPSDWHFSGIALEALGYAVSPITYTYSGISYLLSFFESENLYYVVDLFTSKGIRGTINSTVGTVVGTVWGIQSAHLISQNVINETVAYGCAVLGKSALVKKFISAGAVVIIGPTVETLTVIGGSLVGGMMFVLIGNCVYKLMWEDPIHRRIMEKWMAESQTIVEEIED